MRPLPRFVPQGLCLLLFSCANDPGGSDLPGQFFPVCTVFSTSDPEVQLTTSQREALILTGMTRCAQPFGVLLAADGRMPKEYLDLAVRVLAELLDQDMDGVPDDSAVWAAVCRPDVAWLAMPVDEDDWESRQSPVLARALGYEIIIPSWWMIGDEEPDQDRIKAVVVEEIVHFLTQFGYSDVYPSEFGVEDWTSVLACETQRAQCVFWQHPENDCPDSPAEIPGDCSEPNCDITEFYQQVLVLCAGMEPGWRGIGFPETREELEALLSPEFLRVMRDPAFHQLQDPLRFSYPVR